MANQMSVSFLFHHKCYNKYILKHFIKSELAVRDERRRVHLVYATRVTSAISNKAFRPRFGGSIIARLATKGKARKSIVSATGFLVTSVGTRSECKVTRAKITR